MQKNKVFIILIIVILGVAVGALIWGSISLQKKEKIEEEHLIELNYEELMEKIDNKESFILLFSQTTCSHCEQYRPTLKKVLVEYDLYAYEIATDLLSKEENAKLKDVANVTGTPTTVFIVNGEEKNTANRLVGAAKENKIVSRFEALGYIKK